jgi:hypothetical protein
MASWLPWPADRRSLAGPKLMVLWLGKGGCEMENWERKTRGSHKMSHRKKRWTEASGFGGDSRRQPARTGSTSMVLALQSLEFWGDRDSNEAWKIYRKTRGSYEYAHHGLGWTRAVELRLRGRDDCCLGSPRSVMSRQRVDDDGQRRSLR